MLYAEMCPKARRHNARPEYKPVQKLKIFLNELACAQEKVQVYFYLSRNVYFV
jgi:hypothetical protein